MTPRNKRRKTSSPDNKISKIQTLADLPNDQLIAIANYLPKTSRALLAVALTAPSKSWRATGWRGEPSVASKAIVSSTKPSMIYSSSRDMQSAWDVMEFWDQGQEKQKQEYYEAHWEVLDFVDIEKRLAMKLTDDDIGAVLVCINARTVLKKLRLTHCNSFVGHGLTPLRGSIVLEHIDSGKFSLHSHVSRLSAAAIIPIVNSIIDADGNSLRKLELPKEWKCGKTRNEPPIREFLEKFNRLLLSEEVECIRCSKLCRWEGENSCRACFNRTCAECDEDNGDGYYEPFVRSCDCCSQILCESCGSHAFCTECNSVYCALCAACEDVDVDAAEFCTSEDCLTGSLCLGCRTPGNSTGCYSCQSLAYPKLVEENERLVEENNKLREEVDELQNKLS